jgi:hypothetical protein
MLPQRRKSAEEIAKLRESMGVPGAVAPATPEVPAKPEVSAHPAAPEPPPPPPTTARIRPEAKAVRSLRKSERVPVIPRSPDLRDDAAIPIRRKSERELMELRRIQQPQPDQSLAHLRRMEVPWPVIGFGYLLPLSGALLGGFAALAPGIMESDFPMLWMGTLSRQPWLAMAGIAALALFCGAGFTLAGWFAWKKPRSRHHAGFIALLSLLVLVFGILQLTATHAP